MDLHQPAVISLEIFSPPQATFVKFEIMNTLLDMVPDIKNALEKLLTSNYKFIYKGQTIPFIDHQIKVIELEPFDICLINNTDIEVFTNQIIDKINRALDKFRYNIIIAIFHEIYSFYRKISEENKNYKNLKENFEKILIIMSPVLPHLANESLTKFNYKKDIKWPLVNKKYLIQDENLIVIQVNGKKRNTVLINENLNEKELIDLIKNKQLISKYLDNGEIVKTVYIKYRLINFIVK